jgi:hypothetical protein
MFAIDGKDARAALSLAHDKFTGHHEWLFIGYRHISSGANCSKSRCQPRSPHYGREHKIYPRQASNGACPVAPLKDFNPQVRGSFPQLLCTLQVKYRDIRWVEAPHLLLEQFDIASGCESHDGEPLWMLLDDIQGVDPDGTG